MSKEKLFNLRKLWKGGQMEKWWTKVERKWCWEARARKPGKTVKQHRGAHLQHEQENEAWETCRGNWNSACGHETVTTMYNS